MDSHSPLDYSRDRLPDRESPKLTPSSDTTSTQVSRFDPLLARVLARQPMPLKQPSAGRREKTNTDPLAHSNSPSQQPPASRPSRPLEAPRPPRRDNRSKQQSVAIGLQIRPEERELMLEVGKFRVITTDDLARFVYNGNSRQLKQDLQFLKDQKLLEVHVLNARRDGRSEGVRRFEAVTLTRTAKRLLERTGQVPEGQRVYSGLVKPREAEHDAQIYCAYRKELSAIEADGGHSPRIKLDFELKANVHRAVYQASKAEPQRDRSEIKAEAAEQFNLVVIDDKVVFPDARIEYELTSGGSAQIDIEVATSAYRHGHIAGKSQAGFKIYISHSDIGRLGAAVHDDHNIMSEILDF